MGACNKEGPSRPVRQPVVAAGIACNTIPLNNWITLYDDGTEFSYSSTVTWSIITQEIRDLGMVIAYIKTDSSPGWSALPYSRSGKQYADAFNYNFNTGVLNIAYDGYNEAGSPGSKNVNGRYTIRLVAVPSAVRKANPNLNWMDYGQIDGRFDLPD